jgi:hypothetical protein
MTESSPTLPGVVSPAAPPPTARSARRFDPVALVALVIALVVLVSTVLAVISGNDAAQSYPADTPEGVMQRYLAAWYDNDLTTAYGYFSAHAQAQMPLSEFREQREWYSSDARQSVRLDRVTGGGNSRSLQLSIEESYDMGPFGGGSYENQLTVRLVLEGGEWRIDEPLVGVEQYYGYWDD